MYNTPFIVLAIFLNWYNAATRLYWYDVANDTTNVAPMVIDYLVAAMAFIADIFLTFRTTFFDQENELQIDKKIKAAVRVLQKVHHRQDLRHSL